MALLGGVSPGARSQTFGPPPVATTPSPQANSAPIGSNGLFSGLANGGAGAIAQAVAPIAYNAGLGTSAINNTAYLNQLNAPTLQGLDAQSNLGLFDLQNNFAQMANNAGSAQDTYGNAIRSNNLQIQGNQVAADGTVRDLGYTNDSYNNAMTRLNQQQDYIGQQQGFNNTDLSQTQGYLGTSGTLADQLMAIQNQGAGITRDDADRQARYATEASGGGTTVRSYGDNLKSDLATFQNAQAGNQNTNASTHNSLGYQLDQAQLGHDKTAADLTDQSKGLENTRAQDSLDLAEKRGQIGDQQKQILINAAQYGVNADQLTSGVNHQLQQLNLSGSANAAQIFANLGSTNAQKAQLSQNIVQQALQQAAATVKPPAAKKKK